MTDLVNDFKRLTVFTNQPISVDEFVSETKKLYKDIKDDTSERLKAHEKKGITKKLQDEIAPLSKFFEVHYKNDELVKYNESNDAFDAQIFDKNGSFIECVEITYPQNGSCEAELNRSLVSQVQDRGFGYVDVSHMFDVCSLIPHFEVVAINKTSKNYAGCKLVFVLNYADISFGKQELAIKQQHDDIQKIVQIIKRHYKGDAKSVFLLVCPQGDDARIIPI